MAVAKPLPSSLHTHKILSSCNQISPSLLRFRQRYSLVIKAYMDNPNAVSGFANKVIGSLPIIGLVARILSDEGGTDSRAFYEFQERRGRAGDPLYVLLCCWLAAAGAGLLKSEEILEGVARLRISNDIEFEEQDFIAMMYEAREPTEASKVECRCPKSSHGDSS
ncbi:hypothetical protein V6N13_086742 [Hibiscus sabdariffa]